MTATYTVTGGEYDRQQAANLASALLQHVTQQPPHPWATTGCNNCVTEPTA